MVQSTDNHDLDDYAVGDDPPWDHSDTVIRAEERLVLWNSVDGARANQTAYSGALFVDDSESPTVVYRGDGSSWVEVGDFVDAGETGPRTLTLADGASDALLDTDTTTAQATVIDTTNDELAEYFLRGSNNEAQLFVETATQFDEIEGNAGTINVYWDSANSRYEIENQTGVSVDLSITDTRP